MAKNGSKERVLDKKSDTNKIQNTSANGNGKQQVSNGSEQKKSQYNREDVLNDYRLAWESRQCSLLGRKEVLTGKAKFGIFGDGKEVAQLAMAKAFQNGDFRSGYYRDQTFAFATDISNPKEFFAQLYADTNLEHERSARGRSFNCHYASRLLDENGEWKNLMESKNTSSDISPTAGQMQRLVGLAYASKVYRENDKLTDMTKFSNKGNEVAFGTIGNASCAEGIFLEAINAAAVLMVPMAISIWDDGYGISVPNKYQIAKEDISEVLKGFEYSEEHHQGYKIYKVPGWDYAGLVEAYKEGIALCREKHIPVMFHITQVTQQQGHSTSGSHERYKSKERLQFEKDFDCNLKMREWILAEGIAAADELDKIENDAKKNVRQWQEEAWNEYLSPIHKDRDETNAVLQELMKDSPAKDEIKKIYDDLNRYPDVIRKNIHQAVHYSLILTRDENSEARKKLLELKQRFNEESKERYNTNLFSSSKENALNVEGVAPVYNEDAPTVDGREIMLAYFDHLLERDPRVFVIGEDVGNIGDVNQGLAGMQKKYGEIRVTDTGIRESTIVGQGIGAALRGLRPITEVQYLDYLLYALQPLSDDLATLQYRTAGGQKAPLIIRTRGHRLEGIWHSGSPMGMIINSLRGIHICVPRNMTQAAGMYNTAMRSDEPALIIERLNAYRLKEKMPSNVGEYTIPFGVPEVLEEGTDITVVTYGPCVDIARDAIVKLKDVGISVELIDAQTLLPFDLNGVILESLKKTNRILFLDEDVPGGASAYMMQQVIDRDGGYQYLDSPARCLAAEAHRPPYGSDGDYFSKPNAEEIFEAVYNMMNEADPQEYPIFY